MNLLIVLGLFLGAQQQIVYQCPNNQAYYFDLSLHRNKLMTVNDCYRVVKTAKNGFMALEEIDTDECYKLLEACIKNCKETN